MGSAFWVLVCRRSEAEFLSLSHSLTTIRQRTFAFESKQLRWLTIRVVMLTTDFIPDILLGRSGRRFRLPHRTVPQRITSPNSCPIYLQTIPSVEESNRTGETRSLPSPRMENCKKHKSIASLGTPLRGFQRHDDPSRSSLHNRHRVILKKMEY